MISVCMSTYNGGAYIREQLDSILPQLHADDEIMISDDSSTDCTIAIVESYMDSRIRLIRDQKFASPIYNFENSIKNARGDIIFLADQDDVWMLDKIETTLPYFEEYDMVISDCYIVNDKLEIMYPSFYQQNDSSKGLLHNLQKNSYLGCCMAFKSSLLKKALPFPEDIPMHDIWLGYVAELFFKPVFIKEKLIKYRRHDKNASSTSNVSKNTFLKKINLRWHLLKHTPLLLTR